MTWTTLPNGDKQITLIDGTSLTLPTDWNSSANKVECYGAGAHGYRRAGIASPGGDASGTGGGGAGWTDGSDTAAPGGGGAYAARSNVSFEALETVNYQLGQPGTPDTWFGTPLLVLGAGTNTRLGAAAAMCVGDVTYRGGNGHVDGLGGGGGAGPDGAGGNADEDGNHGSGNGGLAGDGGAPGLTGTTSGAAGAIVVTYTP